MLFPALFRPRCSPKRLLLLGVGVAMLAGVTAQGKVHRTSKRDLRHEIVALEEQWRTAQVAADIPTLDGLLAEDFIGISMTGQANSKSQQLDRFRNRKLIITRIDLSDRKIKLLGPVAIVTSLAEVEGTSEGEAIRGMFRYTRVYQLLPSGVWKTTNFEATRVPVSRQ